MRTRRRKQPRPGPPAHQWPRSQRPPRNPNNRIGKLLAKKLDEHAVLADLFLATLSRTPNDTETKAMSSHLSRAADKRKAWEDIHWALINSKEFLFRH